MPTSCSIPSATAEYKASSFRMANERSLIDRFCGTARQYSPTLATGPCTPGEATARLTPRDAVAAGEELAHARTVTTRSHCRLPA